MKLAEGYGIVHRTDSEEWVTYGGFALLGYAFGRYTPYVQFERIASSGGRDPFFSPGRPQDLVASFDTAGGIAGLRVDLSDWTALKAEYPELEAAPAVETSRSRNTPSESP